MTNHAALDVAFKAWRKRQGLTGVQQDGEVEEFLAERALVQKAMDQWPVKHPNCSIQTQPNKALFEKWLAVHNVPPIMENLEAAFEHLQRTGKLELVEVAPPLPEIETRPGQWTNGVFRAWETDGSRGTIKSSRIGQHDPQASEDEPQIRKRPERMTSAEYAEAVRTSKTFRDRENAK